MVNKHPSTGIENQISRYWDALDSFGDKEAYKRYWDRANNLFVQDKTATIQTLSK